MTLYLIRHSTTAPDPDVSSHTWALSLEGRLGARLLAGKLASHPELTHIFTSTELKTSETGKIMAADLGIPCQEFDGLHEHERHTVPYYPTPADYQAAIAKLFVSPDELVFGEETATQALDRFNRAINQIIQRHPAEHIAIVTHGTVLSLFVARHNPAIDGYGFWRELNMPDCYVLSRPGFQVQRRITIEPLGAA